MMFATSLALIAQEFPPHERGTALRHLGRHHRRSRWRSARSSAARSPTRLGWEWIFLVNVPIGLVTIAITLMRVPRLRARPTRPHRLGGPRDLQRRPLLPRVRPDPRQRRRLGQRQDRRLLGRAPSCCSRLRGGRAAPRPADARPAPVPHPHLHRRADRGVLAPRLDVLDVPLHHALHAEHARLLAARERAALPAGVGAVLPRRAGRGQARRALSRSGCSWPPAWRCGHRPGADAGVKPSDDWTTLLPGFILAGIGIGFINPPLATAAIGVVEPRRSGAASGINSTARQVGTAVGIAGLGAILQSKLQPRPRRREPRRPPRRRAPTSTRSTSSSSWPPPWRSRARPAAARPDPAARLRRRGRLSAAASNAAR